MKKFSLKKYSNFILFSLFFTLLMLLQSHTHLSTSLLSILPKGESKELIETFSKRENTKLLFLTVKGFDEASLNEIRSYEKQLLKIPFIKKPLLKSNIELNKHLEKYKLFRREINATKLNNIDVKMELEKLYKEMRSSFIPVVIDRLDPFALLSSKSRTKVGFKKGHLTLGDYGYLATFQITSDSLDEHQELYNQVHQIVNESNGTRVFSPIFYFVENSNAIKGDVNHIVMLAVGILLLLYLFILKDVWLLLNTLTTLATSAMVATIILSLFYEQISVFVYVFGISISTIAIDYMFHHYLHGYYVEKKGYNREVLFGFLTTLSAFFILSFTSFLLIKQIALFALISLVVSYLHFSFLYPKIGFKPFEASFQALDINLKFLDAKVLTLLSLLIIVLSFSWLRFDFDLRSLDYDNKSLKSSEQFFSSKLSDEEQESFVIKAKSINELISHAQALAEQFPKVILPMAQLVSPERYNTNKKRLQSLKKIREDLKHEAKKLKFKDGYFDSAYANDLPLVKYDEKVLHKYGIDVVKLHGNYLTFGMINSRDYEAVMQHDYVESLSLKERFEAMMKSSIDRLIELGILSLVVIMILLYIITKRAFLYALVFLLFPMALVALYSYFVPLNILHLFMLFIIVAIGIDYAIYLAHERSLLTKQAIMFSLVSTFAGFGVLIFSNINALFSLGMVSTLGVVAIFILLMFMKGGADETKDFK